MNMLVRTAAAAALIAGLGALPAFAEDTIKVGVLVGYSGIGSLSGQQTDATIKLFQQKYGDAPGGHKLRVTHQRRNVYVGIGRDKRAFLVAPEEGGPKAGNLHLELVLPGLFVGVKRDAANHPRAGPSKLLQMAIPQVISRGSGQAAPGVDEVHPAILGRAVCVL